MTGGKQNLFSYMEISVLSFQEPYTLKTAKKKKMKRLYLLIFAKLSFVMPYLFSLFPSCVVLNEVGLEGKRKRRSIVMAQETNLDNR